jgi:acyl-coenzyme A synthetase/AMP-(fatty) acid ligase
MEGPQGAMVEPAGSFPLIGRLPDEPIFWSLEGAMTSGMFLDTAHRTADALPTGEFVVNFCRDRLWFTVALAAALMRGQVTLLTGDRSREGLAALIEEFPNAYAVAEAPVPTKPFRLHLLQRQLGSPAKYSGPNPDIPAEQWAAIVFTSGTTGGSRGYHKSWGALVERSIDAAAWLEFPNNRVTSIVGMVPPQHMYGLETTVLLPLHTAAATWCGATFYPMDVVAALRAVPEPRVLVTTPLQIRTLLRESVDLPKIDRVVSATAPLSPEIARSAEERWATRVFEIFGATEVGSIASRRTVAGDVWMAYPRVRLGRTNPDAETLVTGPRAAAFPLSDVVELLDDRHFRLIGRRSDVVKLAGRRASLAELNRILAELDGVIDGQFVAPEDLDRQPTARLLVFVVAPARSAEDLLVELRHRIDPVFVPRRVIKVDSLPRNNVGKLTDQAIGALRAQARGA